MISLNTLYDSLAVKISYDNTTERSKITTNTQFNSTSIALILSNNHTSCWVNLKALILKHLTWTWISVKDGQGNDTNKIVNINSIAKRVGLTPDEITTANNLGKLFLAIEHKVKESDLPRKDVLESLMIRKHEVMSRLAFTLDESSETKFLDMLAWWYDKGKRTDVSPEDFAVLLSSFAIRHFKYKDIAVDWMSTTFQDPNHVSKNKLLPANISFIPEDQKRAVRREMGSILGTFMVSSVRFPEGLG